MIENKTEDPIIPPPPDTDEIQTLIESYVTEKLMPKLTKQLKQTLEKQIQKKYSQPLEELEAKLKQLVSDQVADANQELLGRCRKSESTIQKIEQTLHVQRDFIESIESVMESNRQSAAQNIKALDERYAMLNSEVCKRRDLTIER
jgi:ElaB/YqjD/DUF883 family membrane-anchored ribosome-binding protein